MNRRLIAVTALAWVLSLVSVGVWAQSGTPRVVPPIQTGQPVGDVITGENIGFQRIAAMPDSDGKVVGRWMVKVNGKWMETKAPVGVQRGGG